MMQKLRILEILSHVNCFVQILSLSLRFFLKINIYELIEFKICRDQINTHKFKTNKNFNMKKFVFVFFSIGQTVSESQLKKTIKIYYYCET